MEDTFVELIVPHKPTGKDKLKKGALIFGMAATLLIGFLFFPIVLIAFLSLCVVAWIFWPRFKMEYEYTYVNGEIDIAKVFSKQSRKEVARIQLDDVECIAPFGSHELDSYGDTFKVIDYSANDPGNKPYVIVKGGTDGGKILIQLNDRMLDDLKRRLPRKVFTY